MARKKETNVVIYARISTSKDDSYNQLNTLREYAIKNSYVVIKEFKKKLGITKREERDALYELIEYVKENNVDKVLIFDCSRLARRIDFTYIVGELIQLGVSLDMVQNGFETLMDNGEVNPIAEIVTKVIDQFNSIETTTMKKIMSRGYDHYRESGGMVGRREGYVKSMVEYRRQYFREINLLESGEPLKRIRSITGTSVNTLRKLKSMFL